MKKSLLVYNMAKDIKMKKLLLLLIIGMTSLSAYSGEDIYKAKCAMCHANNISMDEAKMKAPPMPMVSMRLKSRLQTEKDFITFVDDYLQNPSREKGFCGPRAFQRFGTMPPVGKDMSKEERATVALWLYKHYT